MCKKSLITNLIAVSFMLLSLFCSEPSQSVWMHIGLFAFSGSVTNWVAIHMLFEKVPGLYGSGVVQVRFESIKKQLHYLIMQEFFEVSRMEKFVESTLHRNIDDIQHRVLDLIPYHDIFDQLLVKVEESSLGGMLQMFGGKTVLEPLREDLVSHMKLTLSSLLKSDKFKNALIGEGEDQSEKLRTIVEKLINDRLNELTPPRVKNIIQDMIREHLGWLVVWGGVFGGLIGLCSAIVTNL
ncbi:MAG: DUF445 domain-containing protein [Oligoflexales bacterium]